MICCNKTDIVPQSAARVLACLAKSARLSAEGLLGGRAIRNMTLLVLACALDSAVLSKSNDNYSSVDFVVDILMVVIERAQSTVNQVQESCLIWEK